MQPMIARPVRSLSGTVRVPGDKSISHRAVIFGALAVGETTVRGLLEGEDVLRTVAAVRALGAAAERDAAGLWHIHGAGIGALAEPDDVLDMGNSGTAARLLLGVMGSHAITCFVTGDASLRARPMERVAAPLRQMGAAILSRSGGRLPLCITGAETALPIVYETPVASAQVKSAVLLAGLNAPGETTVVERRATRDHTERMLRHFGAQVRVQAEGEARRITVVGQPELTGRPVEVPADISSAAFPLVAALIMPESEVTLTAVGMNPGRVGLIETLREMGADIATENERELGGEPVADMRVRAGPLKGVAVPAARAPSMIDEFPVLAIAAAFAEGETVMQGIGELRLKESDRIAAIADGLAANGVAVEARDDTLVVRGRSGPIGGGTVKTLMDHRIAMSFLVLGLAADAPVGIDDARPIATSFPEFRDLMAELGAKFEPADPAPA